MNILCEMGKVVYLYKIEFVNVSLVVLKLLDILLVLVEIGFIFNLLEEKLLI